jgi:hypothetical protein
MWCHINSALNVLIPPTGKGLHSDGGVPKLRPALEDLCDEYVEILHVVVLYTHSRRLQTQAGTLAGPQEFWKTQCSFRVIITGIERRYRVGFYVYRVVDCCMPTLLRYAVGFCTTIFYILLLLLCVVRIYPHQY